MNLYHTHMSALPDGNNDSSIHSIYMDSIILISLFYQEQTRLFHSSGQQLESQSRVLKSKVLGQKSSSIIELWLGLAPFSSTMKEQTKKATFIINSLITRAAQLWTINSKHHFTRNGHSLPNLAKGSGNSANLLVSTISQQLSWKHTI